MEKLVDEHREIMAETRETLRRILEVEAMSRELYEALNQSKTRDFFHFKCMT
jgi:hypothetical protein